MEKIKALLLPLALIFAAIAVFEFGARYGATNMRAHAIAGELQFPLNIYAQAESSMDEGAKASFTLLIDNGIATGALHRKIWYLNEDARRVLDEVLAYAFSIRGDAVVERFTSMEANETLHALDKAKLSDIRAAILAAKAELAQQATSAAAKRDLAE